jgi:hypothetical protein
MAEQTAKITESRGAVGMPGRSARLGSRRLDQGTAWTRGAWGWFEHAVGLVG